MDGGAVDEETASDCGACCEEGEHKAKYDVAGYCCYCLFYSGVSGIDWVVEEEVGRRLTPDQVKKVRTINHDASSRKMFIDRVWWECTGCLSHTSLVNPNASSPFHLHPYMKAGGMYNQQIKQPNIRPKLSQTP